LLPKPPFDVGTGSGSAIAAVKLGARKVVVCDIDPIAEIASQTGAQNGCSAKVRWARRRGEDLPFQPDCLVANLTVELIEQEFCKLSSVETRRLSNCFRC
jgi:ribosomal protein L11 methylase PrmA